MNLLQEQGLVAMLETIRRDVAPPWEAYFDFNESYARFLQYMVSRYGAYNMIFSKIHFDIYLTQYSLTAEEFNEAINAHYRKYGPMPFGQPVTSLIDHATDTTFGTGEKAPWITLHSTGNKPRDHAIYAAIERQFRLSPAMPTANLEPHYTGWVHGNNVVDGEQAGTGIGPRQLFLTRSDVRVRFVGGPRRPRARYRRVRCDQRRRAARCAPFFWQALRYESAEYMRGLGRLSSPRARATGNCSSPPTTSPDAKRPGSSDTGLDGWSFLMRTPDKRFGLMYFENQAEHGRTIGWRPNSRYRLTWFDPRLGEWRESTELGSDGVGVIQLPPFPGGQDSAGTDWAAKIVEVSNTVTGATAPQATGGAFVTGRYRNLFREAGHSEQEIAPHGSMSVHRRPAARWVVLRQLERLQDRRVLFNGGA